MLRHSPHSHWGVNESYRIKLATLTDPPNGHEVVVGWGLIWVNKLEQFSKAMICRRESGWESYAGFFRSFRFPYGWRLRGGEEKRVKDAGATEWRMVNDLEHLERIFVS